ncbi:MAG: LacI family DNA-binding transcriptional regulator [Candidatus Promineifilaceae bacterium]
MRPTLKDVASRAGVSYQTVSKVLNGQAQVAEETEARIWQVINELHYRSNVSARNLRTQASNLIGHALPAFTANTYHPVLDEFLLSIAVAAEHQGYHVLSFAVGEDGYYDTGPYGQLYARQQVAGFILANTIHNDARVRFLMERQAPFCAFGRANEAWDFCWVDVDGRAGSAAATEHLIGRGHRRIGFLTWPAGSQSGWHREQGYLAALDQAGLAADPIWIRRGQNSAQAGAEGMAQLLALPAERRPSAAVCVSDLVAIGALKAISAAGLVAGRDVGVTGFDDVPLAEFIQPALTSVRQPVKQVGEQVIALLLKQIHGQPIASKCVLLKPELIVRASS